MTAGKILILAAIVFPVAVRVVVIIENRIGNYLQRQGTRATGARMALR
jgi:hypothetical protein